jgi:hypothetical protein
MKLASLFLFFAVVSSSLVAAELPHLDLEMSGVEYRALLKNQVRAFDPQDELQDILTLGKRNLDWVEYINSFRAEKDKLVMYTAANQVGIPIDAPRESNRQIIAQNQQKLKGELPASIRDILYSSAALPKNPPVEDAVFLEHSIKVDRLYQSASRWLLQEPYLSQYAARKRQDIRGYHFLKKEENLEAKLRRWNELDSGNQGRLTPWLVNLCENHDFFGGSNCAAEFRDAISRNGEAWTFYQAHIADAQEMYYSFWNLQFPRRDAVWTSAQPDLFTLPFLRPDRPEVIEFLMNIEDEWRWNAWQLKLEFKSQSSTRGIAHIVFVPGATPNVNGLGGDRITMDANRPLTDYSARWTIRHEFGHVLGFPDCYVEFYDSERGVMINYQLDIENVMCSRRGKFNAQHFEELKANYFK